MTKGKKLGLVAGALLGAGLLAAGAWLWGWSQPKPIHNEFAAIGALKTIANAQMLFREADKEGDGNLDYGTLAELAAHGLLPDDLGGGTRNGYLFQTTYSATTSEFLWYAVANPVERGVTGHQSFAHNGDGPLVDSPRNLPLNAADCEHPPGVGLVDAHIPYYDVPPDEPPPPPGLLAHVAVGQRYRFRLRAGEMEMEQVYVVTAVRPGEVDYDLLTFSNGAQVGQPTSLSWSWTPPYPDDDGPAEAEAASESLTLGGRVWTCQVTGLDVYRNWSPLHEGTPTFPPTVRQTKGDTVTIELLEIEAPESEGSSAR